MGLMEVRRLTAAGVVPFIELRRAALLESQFAFAASPEDDVAGDAGFVRAALADPDQALFGAFDGADLAGMTGIYRGRHLKARHTCHIWGVYVAPPWRGKGLARRLIQEALAFAQALGGVTHVHLQVSERAPAALALYRSLGFTEWGVEPAALRIGDELAADHHLVTVIG